MPCPFLIPALALAFGLYLASLAEFTIPLYWLLIPPLLALAATSLVHEKWPKNNKIAILLPLTVALSFGALGLLGGELLRQKAETKVTLPKECREKPVEWLITINEVPQKRISLTGEIYYQTTATVSDSLCLKNMNLKPEPFKVRLSLPPGNWLSNSRVTLWGTLREIHQSRNFGQHDFSRTEKMQGIHYSLRALTAAPINSQNSIMANLRQKLENFRHNYGARLSAGAPDKASAIISKAMILGLKDERDSAIGARHARAGTSHLLAVSGLHVGFTLGLIYFLFKMLFSLWRLPRGLPAQKAAAIGALLFLVFYVLFTGASWSTMRAGIMAAMVFSALALGRSAAALNNLAIAALIILLYEPVALFSPGFLLSFAAAGGLIMARPFLSWCPLKKGRFWPLFRYFWGLFCVSLVATLATMPLSNYFFGLSSWAGLFSSLFTIPPAALLVALGSIGAFISPFWPWAADIAALISGYIAYFIDQIAILVSALNLPPLPNPHFTFGGALLYYLAAVFLLHIKASRANKWLFAGAFSLLLALIIYGQIEEKLAPPSLIALDVDQGDALLITPIAGRHILIDGGGAPRPDRAVAEGRRRLLPALKALNIKEIEAAVATHGHPDHIGGLLALIGEVPIKKLIVNGSNVPLQNELIAKAKEHNIPVITPGSGFTTLYEKGETKVILYRLPAEDFGDLSENNRSLVVKFSTGGKSVLLTGDAEREEEEFLIENLPPEFLKSDFFKAGHHGSRTANSAEFLDKVAPKVIFISAGYKNRFGLPDEEILDYAARKNIKILRTDLNGAIKITPGSGEREVLNAGHRP